MSDHADSGAKPPDSPRPSNAPEDEEEPEQNTPDPTEVKWILPEVAVPTGPADAPHGPPAEPGTVPYYFVAGSNKLSNAAQIAASFRIAIVMVELFEIESERILWQSA